MGDFDAAEWLGAEVEGNAGLMVLPARVQSALLKSYEQGVWTEDDVPEDGTSLGQAVQWGHHRWSAAFEARRAGYTQDPL